MNPAAVIEAIPWGVALLSLTALAGLLRGWFPFEKLFGERREGEIGRLSARVVNLETKIDRIEQNRAAEREMCAAEALLKDAQHDAEMEVKDHALRNETQALDALIVLAKTGPDRITAAQIAEIEAKRAAAQQRVSNERAANNAAKIQAAAAVVASLNARRIEEEAAKAGAL